MRKVHVLLLLAAGLIIASVAAVVLRHENQPAARRLYSDASLKGLPQKDASQIDTSHLAANIIPPTNKWFSGIALQKEPKTVFPTPLSFVPTEKSFTFNLPDVNVQSNLINNKFESPLTIDIDGATQYRITRYDDISVDLTYSNGNQELGTVTIVAGLPYIYYSGKSAATLNIPLSAAPNTGTDPLIFKAGKTQTFVAPFDGATITRTSDKAIVSVPANGLVTLYATNDAAQAPQQYAANRVTGGTVSYQKDGNDFKTTITYKTANGKSTYFGRLPHQQGKQISGQQYATIYGPLAMESGNSLSFTTPTIAVTDSLDLSKLTADQKNFLVQTVRQDINAPHPYPEDTYFGGKALYRDAQLLQLALQLNETDAANTVKTRLRTELSAWFDANPTGNKSFYYDSKIHGIVGVAPSFGSDAFNDHHFHYGYFIYAASILAEHDADFKSKNQDAINLLVADIANYNSGNELPTHRTFDPYFGHSWASGSSPFADGNNQESSSEAINAWIATSLWSKQTDNAALQNLSGWMLSNEAAATGAYWMNFDTSKAPYNAGYSHKLVALNWGGKRDYATFFSSDPRAMLGIQLIPMSPSTRYQSAYGQRISEQVKEAHGSGGAPAQFDDFILMYDSLAGVNDQLERAKQLPDSVLDGANSRSYMYAWILSSQK